MNCEVIVNKIEAIFIPKLRSYQKLLARVNSSTFSQFVHQPYFFNRQTILPTDAVKGLSGTDRVILLFCVSVYNFTRFGGFGLDRL